MSSPGRDLQAFDESFPSPTSRDFDRDAATCARTTTGFWMPTASAMKRPSDAAVYRPSNPRIGAVGCVRRMARPVREAGRQVLFGRTQSGSDGLERRQLVEMRVAAKLRRDVGRPSPANARARMQHVARIAREKRHDVAGRNSRRRVVLPHRALRANRFIVQNDRRKLAAARAVVGGGKRPRPPQRLRVDPRRRIRARSAASSRLRRIPRKSRTRLLSPES